MSLSREPSEIQNRGARFLMISAALVIVVAGLREIRPIALPFLVAIFLSVLSAPLFTAQMRWRVWKPVAILVTVLANLGVLVGVVMLVGGSVRQLTAELPEYQERFEDRAADALDWLEHRGIDTSEFAWLQDRDPGLDLEDVVEGVEGVDETDGTEGADHGASGDRPSDNGGLISIASVFDVLTNMARGVASALTMLLLVVLIMVFLLAEASKLPRKLEGALHWSREDLDRMAKAQREVQRYLVYKTLISALTGLLLAGWTAALGVPFPMLWGLIAFLLNYIPSLGSIIAAIPAMLLAWIDQGAGTALLVGLGYLLVNVTLGNFVEPHLMGRRLGISTLVVFLSLVFWGWMWGPVGMLLSVPLTMILRIALENTEDFRWMAQMIAARAPALAPAAATASAGGAAATAAASSPEDHSPSDTTSDHRSGSDSRENLPA